MLEKQQFSHIELDQMTTFNKINKFGLHSLGNLNSLKKEEIPQGEYLGTNKFSSINPHIIQIGKKQTSLKDSLSGEANLTSAKIKLEELKVRSSQDDEEVNKSERKNNGSIVENNNNEDIKQEEVKVERSSGIGFSQILSKAKMDEKELTESMSLPNFLMVKPNQSDKVTFC